MKDLSKLPVGGDEVLLGLSQTLTIVPPMKLGKPKVKIVRWSLALAPRAQLTTVGIGKPKLVTLLANGGERHLKEYVVGRLIN